jgi:cobalt-precorrin 5A hydrolase
MCFNEKGVSMKLAILTVTQKAYELAETIVNKLEQDPTIVKVDIFHKNVKKTLKNVFNSYDCVIGIMATGIMVRSLCGLIKNKMEDPAVIVVDEGGKHVITLLSGHFGGGNDFTLKLADLIHADPVVTTATDVNGKLGVDHLAKRYHLQMNDISKNDTSKIKIINTALIKGEIVEIFLNREFDFLSNVNAVENSYLIHPLDSKEHSKILTKLRDPELISKDPHFSENDSKTIIVSYNETKLFLTPKKLVAGVGSRKGVSKDAVINALESSMKLLKLSLKRLDLISTGDMKRYEQGIIDASNELGVPLKVIPNESLKNFQHPDCGVSDFVMEKFGVPGVSEPCAIISAGKSSQLIFKKTAFNGVTVAITLSN